MADGSIMLRGDSNLAPNSFFVVELKKDKNGHYVKDENTGHYVPKSITEIDFKSRYRQVAYKDTGEFIALKRHDEDLQKCSSINNVKFNESTGECVTEKIPIKRKDKETGEESPVKLENIQGISYDGKYTHLYQSDHEQNLGREQWKEIVVDKDGVIVGEHLVGSGFKYGEIENGAHLSEDIQFVCDCYGYGTKRKNKYLQQ